MMNYDPQEKKKGKTLAPIVMNLQDRRLVYVLLDLISCVLVSFGALLLWNFSGNDALTFSWFWQHLLWVPLLSGGSILVFGMTGLYMISSPYKFWESAMRVVKALTAFLFLYYAIYFFAPRKALPRLVVLYHVLLGCPLFVFWRRCFLWFDDWALLRNNILLLGNKEKCRELHRLIDRSPYTGLRTAGIYDPSSTNSTSQEENQKAGNTTTLRQLDDDKKLTRYVTRLDISQIAVFTDDISDQYLSDLLECHRKGVSIEDGLHMMEDLSGRFPLQYGRSQWIRMFPSPDDTGGAVQRSIKRAVDVIGSLIGLFLFLPLFPFLAIGVKLSSSGPLFFRQERIGQGGMTFDIVKLRSMVHNAEQKTGPQWAEQQDPRVTPFGRFLRLTHLDEFPQFWNVLKGEMSLVGPRPERPEIEGELMKSNPFFKLRHTVKPGITGWATIKGEYVDSEKKAIRRLEHDLFYIENRSIWLDLHILFSTVWHVIFLYGR